MEKNKAFALAEVLTAKKSAAFTLAEVLITLAIIGVVAALTIPTVITNYQKKMYVTQLKKTYNNIINGFHAYMAGQGVTRLTDTNLWSKISNTEFNSSTIGEEKYTEARKEFEKIFKVTNIMNKEKYPDYNPKLLDGTAPDYYGYSKNFVSMADGTILNFEFFDATAVSFCGEKKDCSSLQEFKSFYKTPTKLWEWNGNITVDVNGLKGPNIFGRDIFIYVLGNDGMLYPWGGIDWGVYNGCEYNKPCVHYWNSGAVGWDCAMTDKSQGVGCSARIMAEGWEMKY